MALAHLVSVHDCRSTAFVNQILLKRVITGVVLASLFSGALFSASKEVWILLCAMVSALAIIEWSRLAGLSKIQELLLAGVTFLAILAWAMGPVPMVLTKSLFVVVNILWIFFVPYWLQKHSVPTNRCLVSVIGAIVLIAAGLALVQLREIGAWFVIFILGTIWISDTAAYFTGSKFGRSKLAPKISPGKTWEGVYGAIFAVLIYSIAWALCSDALLPGIFTNSLAGWISLALLMVAIVILGIYGDLFESFLKRRAGVKDSGTLLPGHGGILDRIDALLPVLPLAGLLFSP